MKQTMLLRFINLWKYHYYSTGTVIIFLGANCTPEHEVVTERKKISMEFIISSNERCNRIETVTARGLHQVCTGCKTCGVNVTIPGRAGNKERVGDHW